MFLSCVQASKDVNNMTVKMPYQCFINGQFEDAENGKTYDTINPNDGSVSHTSSLSTDRSMRTPTCRVRPLAHSLFVPRPPSYQVICKVSYASVGDVDRAVVAAKEAFDNGPWGRMNPRDRGSLLYK